MNEPIMILKELDKNNIEYVVLRGFIPIEKINESKDVDIFVPLKYKKQIEYFFKKRGWYTSRVNYSRFPHKQYIYLTKTGFKKIDIVFGLYYSDELYHYEQEEELINSRVKMNGIYVPSNEMALRTLILHVCFDKKQLSSNNYDNLREIIKNNKCDDIFFDIAKDLLKKNNDFNNYISKILSLNILKKSIKYKQYKFWYYIKGYYLAFMKRIRNNNFCIIGVDGAGKSSLIASLQTLYSDKIFIQYMGFKNFESKYLIRYMKKNKNSKLYKFIVLVLQWNDFIRRYFKYRYSKNVVVFDRYPDEAILNFRGFAKVIAFIQYKIFFPKPKRLCYLYCSTETSLKRKDDIEDIKGFAIKKEKFDKKYLNKPKVFKISTDQYNSEETLELFISEINKKYLKLFM